MAFGEASDDFSYRVLFDQNLDAVFMTRPDGTIRRANAAACALFGLTEADFQRLGRAGIVEDDEALREALAARERSGQGRATLTYVRGDGSRFAGDTMSVVIPGASHEGQSFVIVRDVSDARRAEEAVRERNEYIETVLENAPIGFAVNSIDDGVARFVSRRFESIHGLEPGSLSSVEDYFEQVYRDPAVREAMRARIVADMASGDSARMMWENVPLETRSGELRYITSVNIPLVERNLMVSTVQDVTDRVLAERDLKAKTEELDRFFDLASDLLCIAGADGCLRRVSREWTRLLGWAFDELVGQPLVRLAHPDDVEPTTTALAVLVDAGRISGFSNRYRCRDGSYRWLEWRSFAPDGNTIYAVARDFTARREAEQAMRESEARFKRLVEAAPDAISVQVRGRFAYVNEAALRLFGASRPDQLLGTTILERVHPADREAAAKRIQRLNEDQLPVPLNEETVLRLDGSPVTVEVSGAPISYGNEQGAVVFSRDVTERKRLAAQLLEAQRMESIGRLAGGVAHDFNNMLNVILGYADLLLSAAGPSDPARADLEEISGAARRSADLTQQLLAFARKQTLTPQVVDLNQSVSATLRMLERLVGEDIALEWRPAPRLWSVRIDPAQMDQILANLVVNARDAMPGGGRITLETSNETVDGELAGQRPGLAPGKYVRLAVSDTGVGIDSDSLQHVFEPFFSTKAVGKGTGLGLATVYGIVRQHGGAIDVASERGVGTTFQMWFPGHPASAAPSPGDASGAPPGGSETVLVVEDSKPILKLARTILTRLGYRVLAAARATDALDQARVHPGDIDLLLTDVVMPGMNGRELAARLREGRPSLVVLYMSGYTADVIAHHGVLDEGVHFVQKPFTLAALALAVRTALDTPAGPPPRKS